MLDLNQAEQLRRESYIHGIKRGLFLATLVFMPVCMVLVVAIHMILLQL